MRRKLLELLDLEVYVRFWIGLGELGNAAVLSHSNVVF